MKPSEGKMDKRWLKIGLLIVVAAFAFVMLAGLGIKDKYTRDTCTPVIG